MSRRRPVKQGTGMGGARSVWAERIQVEEDKRKNNPFCPEYQGPKQFDKNAAGYGRPVEGSLTDLRAKKAGQHISREVWYLCHVIKRIGKTRPDGTFGVLFGPLFQTYTVISNKVVGMLLRARKHGLVEFPGEILYQGRDDNVFIRLVKLPYDEADDPFSEVPLETESEQQAE